MKPEARNVLLFFVAAILFATPAFMKDLWTPDEPRYALIAKEMLQSGDLVVLHRNGEIYREKPPLLFWSIAALSAPFGDVNALTARLPSIVAALIALVLTYDLARRMFGAREGLWSAIVLATTFRFWWQSNTGQIDMLLTACIMLSMYALWRWHESRRGTWAVAYYAGAALGMLAKGPPALVFTLFGTIGSLWGRRDERRGLRLWLGVPLSIMPVALWFFLARRAGPVEVSDEVSGTFSRQIMGRIFSGVSHAQPPWYYLKNLPIDWFPWVIVLPWTAIYAWRMRRDGPAMRMLLSWSIPALIFFHVIVEKRTVYLMPVYPPLAILVARSLIALVDEGRRGWLRGTALGWVPIAIGVAISPFFLHLTPAEDGVHPVIYLMSAVGVLSSAWTLAIIGAKAWRHWPIALATQAAAFFLAIGIGVYPVVNFNKSSKEFCAPVRTLADAGDVEVMSVRLLREELVFYSNTPHRVVLLYPGVAELGKPGDSAAEERARSIRNAIRKACADIPVAEYTEPSSVEREALHQAINGVLAESDLSDEEKQRYRMSVAREVEAVVEILRSDKPVVIFSTSDDWRWIRGFANDATFLTVLKYQRVSSRRMLLMANPAAVEALEVFATE